MSKPTKKPKVKDMSKNEEKIRVLLEEINGLKPQVNPIITELSRIYHKRVTVNTIQGGKIQDSYITSSKNDDFFTDTKVVLELNNLVSKKIKTLRYKVDVSQFPTSAFDVLIAHFQILLSPNSISFPASDKRVKIKDLNDILLIKSFDKKTLILATNNEYFICKKPLADFLAIIDDCPSLFRIHNRYIVNLKKIQEISQDYNALFEIDTDFLASIKNVVLGLEKKKEVNEVVEKAFKKAQIVSNIKKGNSEQSKDGTQSEQMPSENIIIMRDMVFKDEKTNKKYLKVPVSEKLQKDIQKIIMDARK